MPVRELLTEEAKSDTTGQGGNTMMQNAIHKGAHGGWSGEMSSPTYT